MNVTMGNSTEHSMGQLLSDHQTALTSVIIVSLILGLPLTLHMLWHLQVSTILQAVGILRNNIVRAPWFPSGCVSVISCSVAPKTSQAELQLNKKCN